MASIMKETDAAFEAFYDDILIVRGERTGGDLTQAVPACVFLDEDAEAVSELSMDSTVRTISAAFRDADWRFYGERMKLGDLVLFNDVKFRVTDAAHDAHMGWSIKAREVTK